MGNRQSEFACRGARNFAQQERESNDYYATDPKAVEMMLEFAELPKNIPIWECACGEGHISKTLKKAGYSVLSTDILNRGYVDQLTTYDFLNGDQKYKGNIVTNPPFKYSLEFVERALQAIPDGYKVVFFLNIQFLEGRKRGEFFKSNPPKYVYISSKRLRCAINGDFDAIKSSSAMSFGWFIWEKGYKGETVVRWFNQ